MSLVIFIILYWYIYSTKKQM